MGPPGCLPVSPGEGRSGRLDGGSGGLCELLSPARRRGGGGGILL